MFLQVQTGLYFFFAKELILLHPTSTHHHNRFYWLFLIQLLKSVLFSSAILAVAFRHNTRYCFTYIVLVFIFLFSIKSDYDVLFKLRCRLRIVAMTYSLSQAYRELVELIRFFKFDHDRFLWKKTYRKK